MNSNREGSTMSNEKMAATGMALHWPVGFTKTACGGSQGPDAPTVLLRENVTCGNCILKLAALEQAAKSSGLLAAETTGEHVWNKLQDDLYADFVPAKRGWTPTVGEIGLALGIVVTIVLLFCFVVIAYDL